MRALIIGIFFFFVVTASSQNLVLDMFNTLQNEDGSFGTQNKEIVTSVVLNSYQLSGETPTTKRYGSAVKKAAKMLAARVDALIKINLDERHFYTLQALSGLYWRTGVSLLEASSQKLFTHINSRMKINKSWSFKRYVSTENLPIFIDAIFSYDIAQVEDDRQYELMTALLKYLKTKGDLCEEEQLACKLIKKLWKLGEIDISGIKEKQQLKLGLRSEDTIDVTELALIISFLTDKSQEKRAAGYHKCLRLSFPQQKVLLNELENSAISDLNSLAKVYKAEILKKTPKSKAGFVFEVAPLNWLSMYHFHSYSYKQGKGRSIQSKAENYLKKSRLELFEWWKIRNKSIHEGLTARENELVNAAILLTLNGAGRIPSIDWRFKHNPIVRFFREELKEN